MINGNTQGIKKYMLAEMEEFYRTDCPRNEFLSAALAGLLAKYTSLLDREISLYLSRGGKVLDVSVGNRETVQMPLMRKRRGNLGLAGIRCIHSHPGGSSRLSDVDTATLLSAKLDAMAAVSVRDGEAKSISAAFIGKMPGDVVFFGPYPIYRIPHKTLLEEIGQATKRAAENVRLQGTGTGQERAILVGVGAAPEEMTELALLTDTAGALVVGSVVQMRGRDKEQYVGKGKLLELQRAVSALDVDIVICNDELSPLEARNMEDALGIKIVDRTVLILDIFARHAKTKEGKLQVELAQLQYTLPRLMGEGTAPSRLGGGIGTRGPGETKLEVDRRQVRRRITDLEREIDKLGKQRSLRREKREANRIPEIALVGYTNAGKTSLLNTIAKEQQYAEDKLFATLDPVTRRVRLPSGREVLFTDTVGFIDKLPHDLVSAFRSTLEETTRADLLLHVIDAANPEYEKQRDVVRHVLQELGAEKKPVMDVFNKTDRLTVVPVHTPPDVFYVSARKGEGVEALLCAVDAALAPKAVDLTVRLSYREGAKLAQIQKYADKIDIEYGKEHMTVRATLPEPFARKILG